MKVKNSKRKLSDEIALFFTLNISIRDLAKAYKKNHIFHVVSLTVGRTFLLLMKKWEVGKGV